MCIRDRSSIFRNDFGRGYFGFRPRSQKMDAGRLHLSLIHICIVGEGAPEEEAKQYSSIVKTTVPTVNGVPVFDFVLLGIGAVSYTHLEE